MKKKLLFVFNPKSGKGLIKEHLVNIVDIMTKAGYTVSGRCHKKGQEKC